MLFCKFTIYISEYVLPATGLHDAAGGYSRLITTRPVIKPHRGGIRDCADSPAVLLHPRDLKDGMCAAGQSYNSRPTASSNQQANNKHERFTQSWFNVDPASKTLDQHWTSIRSIFMFAEMTTEEAQPILGKMFDQHPPTIGSLFVFAEITINRSGSANSWQMLGQRGRRWSNIHPPLGQCFVLVGLTINRRSWVNGGTLQAHGM